MHETPHRAAAPGLEVSRGDVLQHQLVADSVPQPDASAWRSPAPALSVGAPGRPASRRTLYATGSMSAR